MLSQVAVAAIGGVTDRDHQRQSCACPGGTSRRVATTPDPAAMCISTATYCSSGSVTIWSKPPPNQHRRDTKQEGLPYSRPDLNHNTSVEDQPTQTRQPLTEDKQPYKCEGVEPPLIR